MDIGKTTHQNGPPLHMNATMNHVSIGFEMEYHLFGAAPLSKPKVNLLYEHSGRP